MRQVHRDDKLVAVFQIGCPRPFRAERTGEGASKSKVLGSLSRTEIIEREGTFFSRGGSE
jgi:hypothetical protein